MKKATKKLINKLFSPVDLDKELEIVVVRNTNPEPFNRKNTCFSFATRPYLWDGTFKTFDSLKKAEEALSKIPEPEDENETLIITNVDRAPSRKDPTEGLTEKQKEVYEILDAMIYALGESGVDVSYFPESADNVVRNYAIDIAKKIT